MEASMQLITMEQEHTSLDSLQVEPLVLIPMDSSILKIQMEVEPILLVPINAELFLPTMKVTFIRWVLVALGLTFQVH